MTVSADDRRWARVADKMASFHNYLVAQCDAVYDLADGRFARRGLSLQTFLNEVSEFRRHLDTHLNTEARHIYPRLAARMPAFAQGQRFTSSHAVIRRGLEGLGAIIAKSMSNPGAYNPAELKQCIDSFRGTLYGLFADELRELHPANMQRYWSLDEVIALPV